MSGTTVESSQQVDWNVLTSPWLEVMSLDAKSQVLSPLDALNQASAIRCIAAASPLDLFAAHRFLLTLLYFKADAAGGVRQVRESLLRGEMPRSVLDAIEAVTCCFRLFDDQAPFLQDRSHQNAKKKDWSSAGSLFAEFASGTNIAHFHHGDDESMRLCLQCATIGMLCLVPWTQSGGRGKSPSVHNAPPIVAIASGRNLAITLGLNLVPLSGKMGNAKWAGHFVPTERDAAIPYLEAFTWNPRRVHLLSPRDASICWRCGRAGVVAVGPIVYLKNEETKLRKDRSKDTVPFLWQDPAAFYAANEPYKTIKSSREASAMDGDDLKALMDEKNVPTSAIAAANPDWQGWHLVIPCTNPANNKTYDHRRIEVTSLRPESLRSLLPVASPATKGKGLDGWTEPQRLASRDGFSRFVQAAARLLTHGDWAVLSAAAYKEMQDSPAAFDLLSGLLWPLRKRVAALPARNVAWLILKLMASVRPGARMLHVGATFRPLRSLPKRQVHERRKGRSCESPYPVSLPRGHRLEADLRSALDSNERRRPPEPIDWAGLCNSLGQLLD